MLEGSKVIKFFEPREKSYGGRMRFSKKMYEEGGYSWLEGTEDLEGIFGGEAAWQERERKERMEKRQREKEERER